METDALHADLKNPYYCEWARFLKEADGWDTSQIEAYQRQELQRVIRDAYEKTLGYRTRMDQAGVTHQAIKTPEDLRKLPLIDKETIRSDLEAFSVPLEGRQYITTSGSTGTPFGFYRHPVDFARELATKAHHYYRLGWKEGDRQFVLRGSPIQSEDHMEFVSKFNELRCSSYHLVPEWMERYRQRALEYRPQWLRCYPSAGSLFAQFLQETGRPFPPLKGVICASENLLYNQKRLMAEQFHTRVFSHYGHYEMAVLAGFCEKEDTYHVLPQYGITELLDEGGQPVTQSGQVGEIVGTSFMMRATLFIRYRTRDLAVLKGWGCHSCGRPYQIWEKVEGRAQEFILSGDGRAISMTALNMHDDIYDHIVHYQFHQKEKGVVTFHYIPKGTCTPTVVEGMKSRLMVKLGENVTLRMEPVQKIIFSSRGKYQPLLQELDLPMNEALSRRRSER